MAGNDTDERRLHVDYTVMDVKDHEGRRKAVATTLGAQAIRANQFDSVPGLEGHGHAELRTGQEEIYVALSGAGRIVIEGEQVDFAPGCYVLIGPGAFRQVIAGPEGLSYFVVGAQVQEPQEPVAS